MAPERGGDGNISVVNHNKERKGVDLRIYTVKGEVWPNEKRGQKRETRGNSTEKEACRTSRKPLWFFHSKNIL